MMTRAAQTNQAGHMLPAGRVFETPVLRVPRFGFGEFANKLGSWQGSKIDPNISRAIVMSTRFGQVLLD